VECPTQVLILMRYLKNWQFVFYARNVTALRELVAEQAKTIGI
jgi:hypothetical protein